MYHLFVPLTYLEFSVTTGAHVNASLPHILGLSFEPEESVACSRGYVAHSRQINLVNQLFKNMFSLINLFLLETFKRYINLSLSLSLLYIYMYIYLLKCIYI